MDWAKRVANLSHAQRLQVGAVIVKDDSVISYGYNGMPAEWDNVCEERHYMNEDAGGWLDAEIIEKQWPLEENGKRYALVTKAEVLHAETNAIAKLAKSNSSGAGADIFVTHAPCLNCAKLIYQSGIKRVFYNKEYRDRSGLEFLCKSAIECITVD